MKSQADRLLILSLVASLILHALWWIGLPLIPFPEPLPAPQTIEVEMKGIQGGRKLTRGKGNASSKTLAPSWDFSNRKMGDGQGDDEASPGSGWGKEDWGVGGGDFKQVEHYLLFRKIWEEVDGMLFYPAILARRKVQGTVNVRLVLNEEGKCNWSATKIWSAQRYLRVYVLDVAAKLCRLNLARWHQDKKPITVDLSFKFFISENGERQLLAKDEAIVGNVMHFQRHSHQSAMEWRLGPLKGLAVFYVGVDFDWLKEQWDTLSNGTDPLDPYRARDKSATP
jgi:hypothetical protein